MELTFESLRQMSNSEESFWHFTRRLNSLFFCVLNQSNTYFSLLKISQEELWKFKSRKVDRKFSA